MDGLWFTSLIFDDDTDLDLASNILPWLQVGKTEPPISKHRRYWHFLKFTMTVDVVPLKNNNHFISFSMESSFLGIEN